MNFTDCMGCEFTTNNNMCLKNRQRTLMDDGVSVCWCLLGEHCDKSEVPIIAAYYDYVPTRNEVSK